MHTSLTDMSQTCLTQTCRKKSHTCMERQVAKCLIHVWNNDTLCSWIFMCIWWRFNMTNSGYTGNECPTVGLNDCLFRPVWPVISPNVKSPNVDSPNANSPNVISSNTNSSSYIHINIWCHIQWLYIWRRVHNRRGYIRRDDIRHLHSASGGSTLYMAFMRNN